MYFKFPLKENNIACYILRSHIMFYNHSFSQLRSKYKFLCQNPLWPLITSKTVFSSVHDITRYKLICFCIELTRFNLMSVLRCGLLLVWGRGDLSCCLPDERSLLAGDLSFLLTGDLQIQFRKHSVRNHWLHIK